MIKLGTKLVRETTALYEYTDEKTGEQKTEDVRVRYYSFSIYESQKMLEQLQAIFDAAVKKKGLVWDEQALLFSLDSLPDIEDAKGNPIKSAFDNDGSPAPEWRETFESISIVNLRAIKKAIEVDLLPKEQPAK